MELLFLGLTDFNGNDEHNLGFDEALQCIDQVIPC